MVRVHVAPMEISLQEDLLCDVETIILECASGYWLCSVKKGCKYQGSVLGILVVSILLSNKQSTWSCVEIRMQDEFTV